MERVNVKLEQKEELIKLAGEIIGKKHNALTLEDKMFGMRSKKQERKIFVTMDALRDMLDVEIYYQANEKMTKAYFEIKDRKYLLTYKAKNKIGVMHFYDTCIKEITYQSFSDFLCYLALVHGVNEKYIGENNQLKITE